MAQQGDLLDQDQFCCSVCLDLLKEPVTIPCGHSYCRSCIEGCWDQDVLKGVYSCPQCRETFTPRPNLRKNNMLAELVEKLKKPGLQAAPPPALCYAGPGDVACDFCTGTRKQKALMSCLVCLASYCETHLQPHYESPAFKKHKLVKATAQLQEKICSHHDKLLEVYCRTDQQCICLLCTMDEHKGHDTVSAAAERTGKQRQLGMSQQKVQQKFQEREKELKELQQAVESLKRSAQSAVEDSDQIFTELIRSIERRSSEVKELIRAQEKAQVSQAEGLLEQLKQEIAELRKRSTELEQLSHTEDHIHFLQIPVSSHWTQTQQAHSSLCLKGTESIIDQLVGSVLIDVFSVTWSCMENGPGTKGQFRTSQPTTSWYHLLSTKLYGLVSQTQMNPSPGLNSMFNVDVQETGPKCVIFHPPILLSPATLNLSSRWCC
ncbi:E3 ubiquitin/ISG15 ligase TRIM25 [Oncorhynchus mykiss]|uniref:E3 ubiquitin/ISG15 ligase TRIM25 n=1 Tax=Oncorhynchus mykiss TaxID=8022 RepID=UPI00187797B3|nr:E3 ubiquitin/ISG15 ligase TRIM25 [Oncorhynchus mykiss]